MARRQPEGQIKDDCRPIAKAWTLPFWQIEGKQRNGVPDTLTAHLDGYAVLLEFKVPGKQPNDQQWLRIHELRQAGISAWFVTSVEQFEMMVGLRPCTIVFEYPPHIVELIRLGTRADAIRR
jgi:hypothetical protein